MTATVIKLTDYLKKIPAHEVEPPLLRHAEIAGWCLVRHHQYRPQIRLDEREIDFLENMWAWSREPSERQWTWLMAIARRIEAEIVAIHERAALDGGPPTDAA